MDTNGAPQGPPDDQRTVIGTVSGTTYVDFDHTLLAANSTELFLSHAGPKALTGLVLGLLDLLAPWRLGAYKNDTPLLRDPIRLWAVLLLFPWSRWRFKRRAPSLFTRYRNDELYSAVGASTSGSIVVVSFGFEFIIKALLHGSALSRAPIIAHHLKEPTHVRRIGKLQALREVGRTPNSQQDQAITDSLEDQDLLNAVAHPRLIDPVHKTVPKGYIPLYYIARHKRTPRFLINQTLLEELPVVLLVTALFQPFLWTTWLGCTLMFLSFVCVYEIGYAENDRVGERNEAEPKLATDAQAARAYPITPGAWLWSLGFAGAALVMFSESTLQTITEHTVLSASTGWAIYLDVLATWCILLVAARAAFYLFNHAPIVLRTFLYLPLQLIKYASIVVLLPTQLPGVLLIAAQSLRMWSLYLVRRSGGDLEQVASHSVRLMVFVMLLGLVYLTTPSAVGGWELWVILAWCVLRAVPEARRKMSGTALRHGMRDG